MNKITPSKKSFFSSGLLRWNKSNRRELAWKGEKDPYKIWLSEIILQQTRVEQGGPYYEKFIKNYPTVAMLAAARDEQVFRLWQGLGYYNRCKNMLAAARQIMEDHDGSFPGTYEELLTLKGVGAYTAAAIASFAFNHPHAVVDGNVYRILSRFFGIGLPIDSTEGKKYFEQLANELIVPEQPAIYNQAIMDMGATVCKPQQPLCSECPLSEKCFALKTGRIGQLPVKSKRKEVRIRYFHYLVLQYGQQVYLRERLEKGIWRHLHEFFLLEDSEMRAETFLRKCPEIRGLLHGTAAKWVRSSGIYRHQLTHQTIFAGFFYVKLQSPAHVPPGYRLVSLNRLKEYAMPRLLERYLDDSSLLPD